MSCLAWHPLDHGLAVGSLAAHSKVGLYTHQGGRQQQQAGQPGEPRQLSTQASTNLLLTQTNLLWSHRSRPDRLLDTRRPR